MLILCCFQRVNFHWQTSFFFPQHFSSSWYKWSRCRFERLRIAVMLLKDHRVFIQHQLPCTLMTSHFFIFQDPQSDGPGFCCRKHLTIWCRMTTSSIPVRLTGNSSSSTRTFAQGRGYQSRVSFFESRQMETTVRSQVLGWTNHIFISNDRMHTAARLPDRRRWLFRCRISGCFFKKPLWIRGWSSRDATPSQKKRLSFTAVVHSLSLWPLAPYYTNFLYFSCQAAVEQW